MVPAHPHATGVAVYLVLLFADMRLSQSLSEHELKIRESRILDTFAFVWVWGCVMGLDAPAHLSAMIL